MAASDAVRSTAIARREVRNSLERMEFHLARGAKGTRGVTREVKFLDALHRQNAIQGANAVGQSVAINPRRSFGQEALDALKGGDGRKISAAKSSVLADFSADGLAAPRSISERFPQWKWQANGSACPTCLSKHGNIYTGIFIPTHPSCLCIAASPVADIRPLTESELIDMNAKYGDPRYRKLMDDLASGRKTMADVRAVENVNSGRKGFLAVRKHNLEGVVRQNALGTGRRAPRTSAPEGGFGPATSAPAPEVAAAPETFPSIDVFTGRNIKGTPTKAMKSAMAEAEQIMADAVGASRGFLDTGIARINTLRMKASKGKKRAHKTNGTWTEARTVRKRGGGFESITREITMEMNRSDFTAHNFWVTRHNAYAERITAKRIMDKPAIIDHANRRVISPPTFKPNPEWITNANNERFDAMQKWIRRNPEPAAKFAATPQQLAETLLHEIVHAADAGTGMSIDGINSVLRRKLKIDGIDKLAAQAYADGDASMWYAAKGVRGKPGETIADLTRMYFYGDRYDTTGQVLKTAAEWRAKYPEMALWVEDNVLVL